ncbi:MAG: ATP synthase F1 subunit delta [Bacteroidetes bacterium]|nr:ATP synthase F1 subunit delta [Bacteroidota bacterium]
MPNPRLAGRYAKSLVDLAVEKNQLEAVHKDMQYLQAAFKSSRELVGLMRSPIISGDKKQKITDAVLQGKIGELTAAFIRLLINKTREEYLPEIVTAVIDQYNAMKGIHKVKLITAEPVSDSVKEAFVQKIKQETPLQNIELEADVKPELLGGFVLEFDNNLVDASIARDLRDIKKQFSQNVYVQQIR